MRLRRSPARGAVYTKLLRELVITPLAAGLPLAFIHRDNEIASALVLLAAVVVAVLASHWIGWLRPPVVVPEKPMIRPSRSSTRLAIVSTAALALALAGTTGCPPGDESDDDETVKKHDPDRPGEKRTPAKLEAAADETATR